MQTLNQLIPSKSDIVIGTKFKSGGKRVDICTVTDIYKTYNSNNELVKTSYVATHQLMGQTVTDKTVCVVTIQRGYIHE